MAQSAFLGSPGLQEGQHVHGWAARFTSCTTSCSGTLQNHQGGLHYSDAPQYTDVLHLISPNEIALPVSTLQSMHFLATALHCFHCMLKSSKKGLCLAAAHHASPTLYCHLQYLMTPHAQLPADVNHLSTHYGAHLLNTRSPAGTSLHAGGPLQSMHLFLSSQVAIHATPPKHLNDTPRAPFTC